MAFTKIKDPDRISLVNNPIPIIYSSSTSAQVGFKYRVIINGSGNTDAFASLYVYGDNDYNEYLIYDASMICSNYVRFDYENWNISGITKCHNQMNSFYFDLVEYLGYNSGSTDNDNGPFWYFQGVKQYEDTFNIDNYLSHTGSTAYFLSKWSGKRKYKLTEYGVVNTFYGIWQDKYSDWRRYVISVNSGATEDRKYYIEINSGVTGYGIYSLPLGPANINDAVTAGVLKDYETGNVPGYDIINSNTNSYSVWLEYWALVDVPQNGTRTTEILEVDVDQQCYKHSGIQFLWCGDLGSPETYTFRYGDVKETTISRSAIKKPLHHYLAEDYSYNIGERGLKNVDVISYENVAVVSDWLEDRINNNLMELYRSSEVWIIKDDNIYPIIITSSTIENKKIKVNKLYNQTIEYKVAYEKLTNL